MQPSYPPAPSDNRWPLTLGAAVVAIAFIATGLAASLGTHPSITDEAWSLLVTRRLLRGERLYADVFSGVTPLSFQLLHAVGRIWENSVLSIRTLAHLMQLVVVACCVAAAGRANVTGSWRAALLAALLVMTAPITSSIYSIMSTAFACIALLCALSLDRGGASARRAMIVGSLACGFAVATKQNVGAATSLAFAICLLWRGRSVAAPQWSLAAGSWVVGSMLPMLPILLEGGASDFLRFTAANKLSYVQNASLSFWTFVNPTPIGEIRTMGWMTGLGAWMNSFPYLLPFGVLLLATIHLIVRRRIDGVTSIVLLFVVASLVSVYPRPDEVHFAIAVPSLLVALAVLLDRLVPRRGLPVAALAGIALLTVWLGKSRAVATTLRTSAGVDGIPEFAGLRMTTAARERIVRHRVELRSAAHGRPMLIVHLDAPTLYLISDVVNPTPYDYPLLTPFGAHGQQDVLSAIGRNDITSACVQPSPWPVFEPSTLTSGIRASMRAVGTVESCELFATGRP